MWNWRPITDVDSFMWFSGYGKWQVYGIGTSKFYCRVSHLVTFGWLLVKHLHVEFDLGQSEMASLSSPWAWPGPTERSRGGKPGAPHFCPPATGVAKLLPSLAALFLPFPHSCLPGRRGQESNHRASTPLLPAPEQGRERGSGAVCQLGELLSWKCAASYGGVHGDGSYCPCFFLPHSNARLVVEYPEVCFLDGFVTNFLIPWVEKCHLNL